MNSITSILVLAFAATSMAAEVCRSGSGDLGQSRVLLCKEVGCTGSPETGAQLQIGVNYGTCCDIPTTFANQVAAVSPNSEINCTLFDNTNCTGTSVTVTGRVNDLGSFRNRAESLTCVHK
ncbi:hypothetical protein P280DRAFT_506394 [Massarina eburnea CBS 473.64]|uniref:Uncharacterized protein n=1 Tax=Massarina eburnea CBS 473.64 TaxID=1395130 RepID=A0A6A6S649_9PLEO|nr:hypothetical protein P280DRAFT_506394 [Massarina eburnea CBS 473.64]